MFDELNKYKQNNHFFLKPTDSLEEVCNAPDDRDGVYVVYELKNGRINMVYIGASAEKIPDYAIKEGLMGLQTSIVKGIELRKKGPRSQLWPVKMLAEGIDALDIYWWVTYKGNLRDHPEDVKRTLIRKYRMIYGESPKWNQRV